MEVVFDSGFNPYFLIIDWNVASLSISTLRLYYQTLHLSLEAACWLRRKSSNLVPFSHVSR
jgi:hypothetical protein